MSHGSDDSDNYWPGYVDALTSMVQVLAFVMMMLAMAVFVLSQSVSKNAVEAIAKSIDADVKPNSSIKQLTESILNQIDQLRKSSGEPSSPAVAPAPAQASGPSSSADASSKSVADRLTEMRVGGQRTPSDRTAARVPSDAPRITVTFEDRSYRIEQDRAESVVRFVSENKATDKTDVVTVDAYAFTGEGALSEARRLAYYRAMTARKQLVDAKVPAENIRINVLDTTEKNKGSTVEIAVGGSAKQ